MSRRARWRTFVLTASAAALVTLLVAWRHAYTISTCLDWFPPAKDPNYKAVHYYVGYPVPWWEVIRSVKETEGVDRLTPGRPLNPALLVVAVVLSFSVPVLIGNRL